MDALPDRHSVTRFGGHSWDTARNRYGADARCGDHIHRNVSRPFTGRAVAGVLLERDRRGRDIRGAISKHERGKVGDFDGRGNGAGLVPSRERVVLSRRLREPRGRRSKHYSEILARPLHSTLLGRGIHVLPLYPPVCGGPRRPAFLNDSPAGDPAHPTSSLLLRIGSRSSGGSRGNELARLLADRKGRLRPYLGPFQPPFF